MVETLAASTERIIDEKFLNSEKFEKAIEKNIPYYRLAFRRIIENIRFNEVINEAGFLAKGWGWGKELKSKFNWPAAIFTAMWFAYRKMWKHAFALEILYYVPQIWIERHFPFQDKFGFLNTSGVVVFLVFNIGYAYLVGTYANSMYFRAFIQRVNDAKDADEFSLRNGTNIWGAIGMGFIGILFGIATTIITSR